MKPQTRRKAVTPNSTKAGTTMPESETNVPKKESGMSSIAENKYISKCGKLLRVQKRIGGKLCPLAQGKHLTFEKAKLFAGKVGELSEATNDKAEITNGLIPAKKRNIALSKPRPAENKYICKDGKSLLVAKKVRGKLCTIACGKHLTLEKAKLIAGKVGEVPEMTEDKTEIMKGLIPFAKEHNIALCKH